jgi:D-alanyl-D-alanine dipeptidase
MRWVRKQNIAFLVAVVVPLITGLAFATLNFSVTDSTAPQVSFQKIPKIQCFDSQSLITLQSTDPTCPVDFISLGDTPLTESVTADGAVVEIHPLLLARFNVAQSFARADGVELTLTSGYRSLERQQMLFQREVEIRGSETEAAKWVLPPQFSHHPKGLAIDVNYPGDKAGAYWLETNGSRFGLCRVYANEWWHFEGVIAPGGTCPALAPNALVDLG